jgi:hypothetical protein
MSDLRRNSPDPFHPLAGVVEEGIVAEVILE